jgi:hypothetical protein
MFMALNVWSQARLEFPVAPPSIGIAGEQPAQTFAAAIDVDQQPGMLLDRMSDRCCRQDR